MLEASDAERLRLRAKRMLEMANRAYCAKKYDFARLFVQLANEVLEHATELEQSPEPHPRQHLPRRGN
jgi:hypothetical protein